MIVVTGTPRSGTSWAMQDCKLLGLEVVGNDFSKANCPEHNPKGYWELPIGETVNGIEDDIKGKVVKLFGLSLVNTDIQKIEKMIVCSRSRNFAVKSLNKFLKTSGELINIAGTRKNAEILFDTNQMCVNHIVDTYELPILFIPMEAKKENPEKWVRKMAAFLEVEEETLIKRAINNAGV